MLNCLLNIGYRPTTLFFYKLFTNELNLINVIDWVWNRIIIPENYIKYIIEVQHAKFDIINQLELIEHNNIKMENYIIDNNKVVNYTNTHLHSRSFGINK